MVQEKSSDLERKFTVRNIKNEDIDGIVSMAKLAFKSDTIGFERQHYESHIKIFPEGQVCLEYEGNIVGSCSSMIVNFEEYGEDHTIDEISDDGFIRNHNPNGINLYGLDVIVHPNYRKMKIGGRLYEARRDICKNNNLKSIVFGGRIPNYHEYADKLTPEEYADKVINEGLYDPVLTFQLKQGFEFRKVIADYLPEDKESLMNATLMEWHNPEYVPR